MADERGLYFLVTPNKSKLRKFKYRYEDKEKKLSFGSCEDVSQKKARDKRKAARELPADGIDPSDYDTCWTDGHHFRFEPSGIY